MTCRPSPPGRRTPAGSANISTLTCQKIATRAFQALRRYALGKGGRPRFRSRFRTLESVEGKSNAAGIRFRTDRVLWRGLSLVPLFDRKDKHGVQTLALGSQVKYVRLVRRTVRGREFWYAQLVMNGIPKWKEKNPVGAGTVGLDLGPSTLAAVSETEALIEVFCPSVSFLSEKIRRISRAMDRSRRATNPDKYNPDGTVKKGPKTWVLSVGYLRLRGALKELHRVMAASRKREQGELANRVIALGRTVKTEKLSYASFQKNFGRSVRDRAPGMFVSILRRKAERAGGQVIECPTRTTKLSQTCHFWSVVKKPLHRRWHRCPCGVGPGKPDLYSAFLAAHVAGEALDIRQAEKAWPGAESLLSEAISRVKHQAAKGRIFPSSFGLGQRQSGLSP